MNFVQKQHSPSVLLENWKFLQGGNRYGRHHHRPAGPPHQGPPAPGLAQLLLEKDLSSITVRELTDLADVNRGTFYTHYRDLYDMLEQMEQEMFQELEDMLDSYASDILQQDITPHPAGCVSLCGPEQGSLPGIPGPAGRGPVFPTAQHPYLPQVLLAEWRELYQRYPNLSGPGGPARRGQLCPGVRGGRGGGPHPGLAGRGAQESPEEMAQLTGQLILSGVYSQAP